MFTDIVFPNNNENEYIEVAGRLEIKNLLFCYEYHKFGKEILKNSQTNKVSISKVNIKNAVIVGASDIKNIKKAKNFALPLLSKRNDRFIFESYFPNSMVLSELEGIAKYDSLHSRHSGLNHILCRLASKNNIVLGVSFSQLLNSAPLKRSMILGRIIQNIRLARKYKMRIKLASFARAPYEMRSRNDMLSFGIVLGMHPLEAKGALEYL